MANNIGSLFRDAPQRRADGGHVGPLPGPTPGRADEVDTTVEDGSHIIPADIVSYLGEGNSENGYIKLENLFKHSKRRAEGGMVGIPRMPGMGAPRVGGVPHIGIPHPHTPSPGGPHLAGIPGLPKQSHLATGGEAGQVACKLSHGEFSISKADVMRVGHGDAERGHRAIDEWILQTRKAAIAKLRSLPPPVGSHKQK